MGRKDVARAIQGSTEARERSKGRNTYTRGSNELAGANRRMERVDGKREGS